MILQLHDNYTQQEIPAVYKGTGIVWTWNQNAQGFITNASGARKLANAPRSTTTPAGEWQLLIIPGPFGQAASARLLPPGALDIVIEKSPPPTLRLWPPMSWDDFKPKTYAAIENHYYNFSPGCKNTYLSWAAQGWVYVVGAVATVLTAGTAAPVAAAAATAVAGASAAAAELVKQKIEEALENAIQDGVAAATASMEGTGRKRLDYGAEVDRIRRTYTVNYQTWANLSYLETYTKSQLESQLQMFQISLDAAHAKCRKSPCDTAGCRDSGILFLRVQYVELLLSVYEATNTSTPAEYNKKVSDEFYSNIPAQDLERVINNINGEQTKKTAALSAFLILGALFSGLLKKS